ncbi:hypothetical protein AO268_17630 [Pseudomonas sp. ICMP 8385]|nr:hypothetical protein AO268_17630 [Pseudomonas sp. ICMP 8385]
MAKCHLMLAALGIKREMTSSLGAISPYSRSSRFLRQQAGISFVAWPQQACLLAVVVRLGSR